MSNILLEVENKKRILTVFKGEKEYCSEGMNCWEFSHKYGQDCFIFVKKNDGIWAKRLEKLIKHQKSKPIDLLI